MNILENIFEESMDDMLQREFCVANMKPVIGLTGESDLNQEITTEDIIKMINGTNENQCTFEAFDDLMSITDNLYERLFTEASAKTPSQMRQIVDKLNRKGYKVKYASPGHQNTAFKNDVYSDHVINGKLTTTARVIFKNPEIKVEPPYLWQFKVMDDCTGIYVKPYSYSKDSQGSPQEAFAKWQEQYMISLDEWASKLDNIIGKTEHDNINNSLNNMKSSLRWKK